MKRPWTLFSLSTIAAAALAWSWTISAQPDGGDVPSAEPAAASASSAEEAKAWRPRPVDAAAYRDIVDFNIFRSDRAALAQKAAAKRNPQPVVSEIEAPVEVVPTDPDADFVLVGVVLRGPQQQAFIEDRRQGEVVRIAVPGEFSAGRLTSIDTAGVVYRIDGEDRVVSVGSNFVGESTAIAPVAARPQPVVRRPEREESEEDNAQQPSRGRPTPEEIERFRRQRQRN